MSVQFPGFDGNMALASALADTGSFIFVVMFGFGVLATLAVYIVTIAVEAGVMRYLQWDDIWRCLFDSWLINTVSIGAGIALVLIAIGRPIPMLRFFEMNETLPGVLMAFFGAWAISIGLEGAMLWAIRRRSAIATWRMTFIINVASYVVLILLYLVVDRFL